MSPAVILSLLLGSIYGLLCHAFIGRHWRQLPLYWGAGLLGFFAGYAAAVVGGSTLVHLGAVPLIEATVGSGLALALVGRLARRGARAAVRQTG